MIKSLLLLTFAIMHPVHVSMVSLEVNQGEKRIEFFGKLYAADLAWEMQIDNAFDDHLILKEDVQFLEGELEVYFNRVLLLQQGKSELSLTIETVEREEHEVIVRGFYNLSNKKAYITVNNLILSDLHSDQENLLIFKSDKEERSVRFTKAEPQATFKIR